MQVKLKQVHGPWTEGWVLDKHSISSTYLGENEYGRPQFDTVRTDVGEATYQLKYRGDWTQVEPLASELHQRLWHRFASVGFIVPMPASTKRDRQPVSAVAEELGKLAQVPVFHGLLLKESGGRSLKDLHTKEDKVQAIGDSFKIHDEITNEGKWDVLVVDDLYHTGASMEAACNALRSYPKVGRIYVAALTWR